MEIERGDLAARVVAVVVVKECVDSVRSTVGIVFWG